MSSGCGVAGRCAWISDLCSRKERECGVELIFVTLSKCLFLFLFLFIQQHFFGARRIKDRWYVFEGTVCILICLCSGGQPTRPSLPGAFPSFSV